jgi:metal-responsive CopG/Arc/MetJ family transcriptional regulator
MKVKTSVTLSEDVLAQLDRVVERGGNRSAILEQALRDYLSHRAKRARDAGDLEILNRLADDLNDEASDVLAYQVDA